MDDLASESYLDWNGEEEEEEEEDDRKTRWKPELICIPTLICIQPALNVYYNSVMGSQPFFFLSLSLWKLR